MRSSAEVFISSKELNDIIMNHANKHYSLSGESEVTIYIGSGPRAETVSLTSADEHDDVTVVVKADILDKVEASRNRRIT